MSSDNQLNIRVDAELKRAFIERAKTEGTSATELLVGYMKQYLGIPSDRPTAFDTAYIERELGKRLDSRLDSRLAELKVELEASLNTRLAELRQQDLGESAA